MSRYFGSGGELKPGVIGEELAKCLGIHKDKLPIWIYRMRVLGYPPGWLHSADMTDSMLDIHGDDEPSVVSRPDEIKEKTYNFENLVVYPGFNAPIPEGVKDDHVLLRMPPMMDHQQLTFAKASMKCPRAIPFRRIITVDDSDSASEEIVASSDNESAGNGDDHEETSSPTKESNLEEGEVLSSDGESEVKTPKKRKRKEPKKKRIKKLKTSPSSDEEQGDVDGDGDKDREKRVPSPAPMMEEIDLAHESISAVMAPVTHRPGLDAFSENGKIAELILFENLDNQTGQFDKMMSVLSGVRKKLAATYADEDRKKKQVSEAMDIASSDDEEVITLS